MKRRLFTLAAAVSLLLCLGTIFCLVVTPLGDLKVNLDTGVGRLYLGAFLGRFQFAFDRDDWPVTDMFFATRSPYLDRIDSFAGWDSRVRASKDSHGAYHLSIPYW